MCERTQTTVNDSPMLMLFKLYFFLVCLANVCVCMYESERASQRK
jgi:hypothetical protein